MAEKKGLGKFLVYCALVLAFFLVIVPIIFSFKGRMIRGEIIVFLFLILVTLIGFLNYRKHWGEMVLFFMFLMGLSNLVLIWYFTNKLFLLPLFLVVVGFLMSWPKKESADGDFDFKKEEPIQDEEVKGEPYSEVFEEEKAAQKPAYLVRKPVIKAKHDPGKYLASNMGSVYHEPKCEWANNIKKERRVWFVDKKEARSKGYKAHKCVR